MQLSNIKPRTTIVIKNIVVSESQKDKLLHLGICKDVELFVLQNIVGNIVVVSGEARISLGKQITTNIEVEYA